MSDIISDAKPVQVDLSNCEKEPIHIPGHIQAGGALLVLDGEEKLITQASTNVSSVLGHAATELLNQPVDAALPAEPLTLLRDIQPDLLENNPTYICTFETPAGGQCHLIAHKYKGVTLLELEPAESGLPAVSDFHQILRASINRLKGASTLTEFAQRVAEEMHRISGFDRVMVYQFQPDLSGKVMAEVMRPEVNQDSFLGLHYPASDIPAQARRLFLQNIVRVIPQIDYVPTPVVPDTNPTTGEPLDMTYAFLRGVSPIHIEYLQNMGVNASLTLALEREGELWGLVACHHYSSRTVDYTVRTACEFLAHSVSLQLTSREDQEHAGYQAEIDSVQTELLAQLGLAGNLIEGLTSGPVKVDHLIHADGIAIIDNSIRYQSGKVPAEKDLLALAEWLRQEHLEAESLYATSNILEASGGRFGSKDFAGVLALSIGKQGIILWFRQEQVQNVRWAGNPEKPVEASDDGVRLSPRKSFDAWTEQVRNQALPWLNVEKRAVRRLEITIKEIVLRQTEELERLNEELSRSNVELDSFAYIASHDLKEPLRGIHNYSQFLLEDYGHLLDQLGIDRLNTLGRLSQRMENLLDSLLYYSRAGRVEMSMRDLDLNTVVKQTLEMLQFSIESKNAEIVIPRPLPMVYADEVRVGEVFFNLISNALKYSNANAPRVEIGYADAEKNRPPVFYVKDNGIGIDPRHHEVIFRIFKRLHGRDKFDGGTGAGLAITKKIIERHNGNIWLQSESGAGTTFFFTLAADPESGVIT